MSKETNELQIYTSNLDSNGRVFELIKWLLIILCSLPNFLRFFTKYFKPKDIIKVYWRLMRSLVWQFSWLLFHLNWSWLKNANKKYLMISLQLLHWVKSSLNTYNNIAIWWVQSLHRRILSSFYRSIISSILRNHHSKIFRSRYNRWFLFLTTTK